MNSKLEPNFLKHRRWVFIWGVWENRGISQGYPCLPILNYLCLVDLSTMQIRHQFPTSEKRQHCKLQPKMQQCDQCDPVQTEQVKRAKCQPWFCPRTSALGPSRYQVAVLSCCMCIILDGRSLLLSISENMRNGSQLVATNSLRVPKYSMSWWETGILEI